MHITKCVTKDGCVVCIRNIFKNKIRGVHNFFLNSSKLQSLVSMHVIEFYVNLGTENVHNIPYLHNIHVKINHPG